MSKNDQNFNQFLTSTFGRFGVVWGRHLGVIFATFRRPSWAKFGPKRVSEAYLCKKRENSRNITFTDVPGLRATPRWPPKCPKFGPRRFQEALEEQLFRS